MKINQQFKRQCWFWSLLCVFILLFLGIREAKAVSAWRFPPPVEGRVSEIVKIDIGHAFGNVESITSDFGGFSAQGGSIFSLTLPYKAGLHFIDLNVTVEGRATLLQLPVVTRQVLSHTFKLQPDNHPKEIALAGSFNGWSRTANMMSDPDGDGIWTITIEMPAGRQYYKFVVNGNWIHDPLNPHKSPDGFGGYNSVIELREDFFAPQILSVSEEIISDRWKIGFVDLFARYEKMYIYFMGRKFSSYFQDGKANFSLPVSNTVETLHLWCKDNEGRATKSRLIIKNFTDTRSWPETVIYSLMLDRFLNADPANDNPVVGHPYLHEKANWHGGDFRGVIEKIETGYFSRLDINAIWLKPVNLNPPGAFRDVLPPHRYFTGYHGYWPISATEVDPRFGSASELRELIDTAREHNIKIMADMVFNHTHEDHPWHKENPEWFGPLLLPDGTKNIRKFDCHPFTTWFDVFLPSFDFSHEKAMEAVTDNAIWWIEEFGFSGLRLDAVKHIPHKFWKRLSERIRGAGVEDFLLLGETIDSREIISGFISPYMIDGQFDFPLHWLIRNTFALGITGFDVLSRGLWTSINEYPHIHYMSHILGTHDSPRFISFADGDIVGDAREIAWVNPPQVDYSDSYRKLKMAFTFLLTIPGIPTIYYGDEIGMPGAADPDNRRPMRFDHLTQRQKGVFSHVASLNKLRGQNPAAALGWHKDVIVEEDFWVYQKNYFDNNLIVAFNRSERKREVRINLDRRVIKEGAEFTDIFSGRKYTVGDGRLTFRVPPLSSVVLELYLATN